MTTPVVLSDALDRAASERPCPHGLRLSGMRVLIVDDDEEGSEAVLRVLAGYGAVSEYVRSVIDAVEAVSRSKPDFVIAGLQVDGEWTLAIDVCGGFALPTISLSTEGSDEMRQRSRDAGFTYHFTKPLEADLERLVALAVSVFSRLPE